MNKTFKQVITIVVAMFLGVSVVAQAQTQKQRVTLNVQKATLTDVFKAIEKQTTYHFSYKDVVISNQNNITLNQTNVEVGRLLSNILPKRNLKHEIISNNAIIITPLNSKKAIGKKVEVTGTILDDDNQPIIGVTIYSDIDRINGTVSDIDGKFAISIPTGSNIIVSYIGYQSQTIAINKKEALKITLEEENSVLDEVIAVGYGNMKKSDLTGAIATIKAAEVQETGAQSLAQALQGKVAGVQISTNSAAPGGGTSIRIRGTNSLMADANPLYVVDGFPIESDDINNINLNDIASIEILKDASSTAIYGSRGANGVILIQTNMGNIQKPKFTFTSGVGIQDVYRDVELLNGQQFAELFNEYQVNKGEAPYYDGSHRTRPLPEDIGEGTNWFDQIIQTGVVQNYNLSVAGGSEAVKYRVAGGYYKNKGVITGGEFDRLNLNVNTNITMNSWLSMQTYVTISRTDTDSSGDNTGLETSSGTLNNAMKMSPAINVYDVYGNYNPNSFPGAQSQENPVAYANEVLDNVVADNAVTNISFTLKPLKGMSLVAKFGANIKDEEGRYYLSNKTIEGAKVDGRATLANMKRTNLINEYVLNYRKEMKKHKLFATGAFSMEQNSYERNSITGTGLDVDRLSYAGIASAQVVSQPALVKYESSLMSLLARVNYNYDNKYLLTLTNRTDGNSGFSEGNKWGNFPSVALAWRVSQESFLKNVNQIDDLKFRASWGLTGNSKIGNSRSLGLLTADRYPFGDDVESGMKPNSISNPDLKWESTAMYNAGIDLTMLNQRLLFSVDAYYKYTSDMLMSYDIPANSGYQKAFINAGELENKGLEFSLTGRPIMTDKLKWTIGSNISFNRDKVTKLYGGHNLIIDIGDKQSITIREGQPIRQFQGAEVAGINPDTGEIEWVDRNDDGKINNEDNIVYGSAFPDFTYGINSKLEYHNFSFDVFLAGSEGNWVQNRTLAYLSNTKDIRNNMSSELLDRWQEPGDITDVPKLGSSETLPTFEDASYFRIQNVSLSYTFPKNIIKNIDKLTIYASIENLYVWTDYTGWDPDVNSALGGSENVNVGQDVNSYPRPRVYRMGINFNF